MKILHLTSSLAYGGGMENIVTNLIKNNNNVESFLCVVNKNYSLLHLDQINKSNILLCNRNEGEKNIVGNLKVLYYIFNFIKSNNIKIVHIHEFSILKIAYLLKKILNVKIIFTIHDTKLYEKQLLKYPVDYYIAISKSVYKKSMKLISNEKLSLIYNGVPLANYFESRMNRKNIKKDYITISCVARVVPEKKGQDILLKSLALLKNKYNIKEFKCFFAGNFIADSDEFKVLEKIINENDLQNNVEFLGNVDNIVELYGNTDIFVLPSRYEGFGLVIVEALASGCEVIVSKIEGPLEIVKENELYGQHFDIEDFNQLSLKLIKSINNFNKDKYNYEILDTYLINNFSIEKMVYEYNLIYKKVKEY